MAVALVRRLPALDLQAGIEQRMANDGVSRITKAPS